MARLLLLSSSRIFGSGYLDHAEPDLRRFLAGQKRVLFVPHALFDRDAYAVQAKTRFAALGLGVDSLHETRDPEAAVADAGAIFVGGGNTFRLVDALARLRLLDPIRERVLAGAPYVGSSAGAIVSGPTLQTTKDMPVVEPPSFRALGLVPFQISPHFLDPDPRSTHMGETQEERILQYLEENDRPVAGLREGAILEVDGDAVTLRGAAGGRFFRRGSAPVEAAPVCDVGPLLEVAAGAGS